MKIPLLIGKDSAGKNQFIDLSDIPVLMISHCDEMQLTSIFSQFGLFESSTRHYLITNTRYFNTWKFGKDRFRVFTRDEPEFDIISRNIGCSFPGSVAQNGNITYFLANDGFYSCNGQQIEPIGFEKVNRFFATDAD